MSALAVLAAVVMAVSAPATEGNPLAAGLVEEFSWDVFVVPKRKFLGGQGPWWFFVGSGPMTPAARSPA